jgi:FtsH-binding integral membrane protein
MWNLGIRLWAAWRFTLFLGLVALVLFVVYQVDGAGKVFGWTVALAVLGTVAVFYTLRDFVRREINHRIGGRL